MHDESKVSERGRFERGDAPHQWKEAGSRGGVFRRAARTPAAGAFLALSHGWRPRLGAPRRRASSALFLALVVSAAACGGDGSRAPDGAASRANRPTVTPNAEVERSTSPVGLRDALDEELRKRAAEAGVPGAASTLVIDGQVAWSGGAGMADVRARRAMTARTPVWFASVSKTVTAAVALKLVDDGRLRLDDSVRRWVPEWSGPRSVTVRRLLNHTSGLRDPGDAFWERQFTAVAERFSPRDWLDSLPDAVPRQSDEPTYANVNFILAGLVIRRVAKGDWTALRHRVAPGLVLQPDELVKGRPARSYVFPDGAEPEPFGDGSRMLPSTSVATAAWTAGAWAGTVETLAGWANGLFEGRILTPAALHEMTAFRRGSAMWGEYGLGVSRMREQGYEVWGHTGHGPGLHSELWHVPQRDLTLVTVWNDDTVETPDIQRALLEIALDHL